MGFKVLLINPALGKDARWDVSAVTYPPLGICWLAAILEKEGYEVKIIDNELHKWDKEELKKEVQKFNPDLMGMVVLTIKAGIVKDLTNYFKKELPYIKIVLGGKHVTNVREKVFEMIPNADFLMIGEAYFTLLELTKKLEKGIEDLSDVNGLVWKKDTYIQINKPRADIRDLDVLPFPARHLLQDLTKNYQSDTRYLRKPSTSMITSLGCYYRCAFCDHSRNVRFFSPEYVANEIEHLKEKYGIKEIHFWDDVFMMTPKRGRELANKFIERKLNITWSGHARLDIITRNPDLVPLIKKSGCWYLSFGIESGAQKVRDFIKKDLTDEDIRTGTKLLNDANIFTRGLFMLGHLSDDKETIQETINLARSLPLNSANFNLNIPLPGTEQYDLAPIYGDFEVNRYENMSGHGAEPVFIPKGLTKEYLLEAQRKAYRTFYTNPKVFIRNSKWVLKSPDSLRKYASKFITIITH